ncbi:MAG: succinate dehydrogenase/fumarate reductase iron-sulfur subunit [Candidatus Hodarchaeales archaeon]|jgi:succinate dehydrogenase / fumarate reductase iron-sulfur subunit
MSEQKKVTKTITFKIKRFNPVVDSKPYWDTFDLECDSGTTVLLAISEIIAKHDGSVAMRYNCRAGVCGSCAVLVNKKYMLACETLVLQLNKNTVKLEPLPFYPVIKDLIVDMSQFYEKLLAIEPYLKRDHSKDPETEILQSPDDFHIIEEASKCILCGACTSSCVSVWTDKNYLGPAALLKAFRFANDTRDEDKRQRISRVTSEDGVFRCHTAFNCVEACPKELNPTEAIQTLKRQSVKQIFKFWNRS